MPSPHARSAWFPTLLAAAAATASATTPTAAPIQPLEDLRRTAEQTVSARLNAATAGAVAHVTAGNIDPRTRLPRCNAPLEALLPATLRETARMTVGIRCTQPSWTFYLPVSVETEMQVLVLRQAAARNTALAAGDVELQTRRVPGMATSYLTDPAQLERRHLRIAAGPGTALTQELLVRDVLIRRGQRVTLVATAGGIEVRAQGEAIADANASGRVRVLNLSSGRIVEGQAGTDGQVRVDL